MDTIVLRVILVLLTLTKTCEGWDHYGRDSPNPYIKHQPSQATFRVAAYDQAPRTLAPGGGTVTRQEALAIIQPTLQAFGEQAVKASLQGADMIVFAEYGIIPRGTSRDSVLPFLESIPSPRDLWSPCVHPTLHTNTEIQRTLSCIARNNSIYVIANMGDVVHCGKACPPSGRLQYNTNVVYDPNGTLIARYHKQNLFFEFRFDTPTTTDYSYFDTPFGRFGTFICFDVLFQKPPIALIEEYGVDHVAFPTAWMNVMPYFSAVPFHQSFAIGHGVNFIAANLHLPSGRFSGSGIYASNTTVAFRNDDQSTNSTLLIGDLLSKPAKITRKEVVFTDDELKAYRKHEFQSEVFGDVYNFVSLDKDSDTIMICHGVTCCHLSYEKKANYPGSATKDHFALGAFRGLHTREGTYYIEVCALMKCGDESQKSCGETVKTSSTYFTSFNLTGNFTTKYVYPQVSTDQVNPAAGQWAYDGRSISSTGTEKPLLGAIFFARRYDLDGIGTRNVSNLAFSVNPSVLLASTILSFWLCLSHY